MKWLLPLLIVCLPAVSLAVPQPGQTLPRLVLSGDDNGEMVLSGDDITYRAFDTAKAIPGKPRLVVYMAGRTAAKKMSEAMIAELTRRKPSRALYQAVTIMDLDDCMIGTCGIARGKLGDRKRKHPYFAYVADEDGVGHTRWRTREEGFTAFLTDASGTIVRVHEGKMSAAQAKALVDHLFQLIGQ